MEEDKEKLFERMFVADYKYGETDIKTSLDEEFKRLDLSNKIASKGCKKENKFYRDLAHFSARLMGLQSLFGNNKLDSNFEDYEYVILMFEKSLNDFIDAYQNEKERREKKWKKNQ